MNTDTTSGREHSESSCKFAEQFSSRGNIIQQARREIVKAFFHVCSSYFLRQTQVSYKSKCIFYSGKILPSSMSLSLRSLPTVKGLEISEIIII